MELIYLYIPEYRGFKHAEFPFSKRVKVQYNRENSLFLCERKNSELPKNFWGENITDFTMIVGNNGAGKTSLMQFIIEMYRSMFGASEYRISGLMIFEEDGTLFFYDSNLNNVQVKWKKADYEKEYARQTDILRQKVYRIDRENAEKYLAQTKLIYKTDVLSHEDYYRNRYGECGRFNFLYDCSLGGLFQEDSRRDVNSEMREHIGADQKMESYFTYERYKQIKFVFDKNQYRTLQIMREKGYPVPIPERLYMDLLLDNRLRFEWKRLNKTDWKSKNGKFLFGYERIWNGQTDVLKILSLALARGTVLNAFRSFLRFLVLERLKEALFDQLLVWDSQNEDMDVEESFSVLIEWLWKEAARIAKAEGDNSRIYYSEIQQLLGWKENYLKFLDFIMKRETAEHFQCENEKNWIQWEDINALSFSIQTSEAEWFMEFLQKYRYVCNPYYFLDFRWGLSSGESNLLSIFSAFYYIFDEDYTNEKNGTYRIKSRLSSGREVCCDSVIIMIDEADITFHPQWQTEYIAILTEFLNCIYPPECCRSIQLLISTHSPILLGDMPSDHVLYLKYDSVSRNTEVDTKVHTGTFGQNIYLLFRNSFFLTNGTMGRFAKNKINDLLKQLQKLEDYFVCRDDIGNDRNVSEELNECEKLTSLIGEPIIRNKLMKRIVQLRGRFEKKSSGAEYLGEMSDEELDMRIRQLEHERNRRNND